MEDDTNKRWQDSSRPNTREEACGCGGGLDQIDSFEQSSTVRCGECDEVYLMVGRDGKTERKQIMLRDWDERRGGDWGRPLDDLEAAKKLRASVTWDQPLTPALITDFGVATDSHYMALQQSDASAYELDRALGDGQAVTLLMRETTSERFKDLEFETPYDCFYSVRETQQAQQRVQLEPTATDQFRTEAGVETAVEAKQEKDRGRER